MASMMAQHEPSAGVLEQMTMPAAWRKWEQAGQALDKAEEPEDFETVGMRCREIFLSIRKDLLGGTKVTEEHLANLNPFNRG
jgi:hypothetical protein